MAKSKPIIVMLFGTFDIFHKGHKNFIAQARVYGDYLIAVIARDKTVLKIKNKLPKNNENERLSTVCQSGLVDKVILGSHSDKYAAIKKYHPDIICLGYDQTNFIDGLNSICAQIVIPSACLPVRALPAQTGGGRRQEAKGSISSQLTDSSTRLRFSRNNNHILLEKIKIVRLKPYELDKYKSSLL